MAEFNGLLQLGVKEGVPHSPEALRGSRMQLCSQYLLAEIEVFILFFSNWKLVVYLQKLQ